MEKAVKIKTLTYDGITIPVNTPCRIGGNINPECRIISRPDHCAAGEIEQAYCTTCGEIVHQKIIK